jgi:hypothetical protein
MKLEGSCHCGAVRFSVESHTPYPFMRCYCSICRKTAGTGGFAINIMGDNATLQVKGRGHVAVYQATIDGEKSEARRHFCKSCGTALWLWDPRWPGLVHPHAGAVDTPLPKPKQFVDLMLGSMAPWCIPHTGRNIDRFDEYPKESIEEWHKSRGLLVD